MIEKLNFQGSDWAYLKEHLESEIQRLREANDSPDLSADQTALIRGEIKALKRILWTPERIALERQSLPSFQTD